MPKMIKDLIGLAIAFIEITLIFRFVLKLLAANPNSGLVAWIYQVTVPFLTPFEIAFPNPSVRGGFVLEFTTLFAIFAYAFLGYILQEILEIIVKKSH